MSTLFASFSDSELAKKAVGALIDQGARPEDVSLIANEPKDSWRTEEAAESNAEAEQSAKHGITTTTGGDAVIGAAKGSIAGASVGIVAALVALAIPGIGLVLGGGALALAVAAAAGTAVAGAAVGGVTGFLEDQGMGPEVITRYSTAFIQGGSILAVAVPSGTLLPEFAEQILAKYGAAEIATYSGSRTLMDEKPSEIPMTIDNPNLDPIQILQPTTDSRTVTLDTVEKHADEVVHLTTAGTHLYAGERVPDEIHSRAVISPMVVDQFTGQPQQAMLYDPITGIRQPIRYLNGAPIYLEPGLVEHPVVTKESDTVVIANDLNESRVTISGSERVSIL